MRMEYGYTEYFLWNSTAFQVKDKGNIKGQQNWLFVYDRWLVESAKRANNAESVPMSGHHMCVASLVLLK